MLQKLRSRHRIDLPAEGWQRRGLFLGVMGTLVVLALLIPLALAFFGPLLRGLRAGDWDAPFAIGVGILVLVLVLLVYGARGKPGHSR